MTEIEITGLLFKLADHGITGIKVFYDGSGDSGGIDGICFTNESCETPEHVEYKIDYLNAESNLADINQELYNEVENFIYEKLLDKIEDWWNNEGGYGDVCICIPSGEYVINNHVRIAHTEDYVHEGSFLDKAE